MIELRIVDTQNSRQFCWIPGQAEVRIVEKQMDGTFKQTSTFKLEESRAKDQEAVTLSRAVSFLVERLQLDATATLAEME